MFFYRKVNNLKLKEINLSINFSENEWKYFKLFSNVFITNIVTNQTIILNYKRIRNYSYSNLSKDLSDNYTEIKYNENIFYHYFKNFIKEEILQYEWLLIKDNFLITFTTTISSKKSDNEIDEQYENVNNILKQIIQLRKEF